MPPSDTHKHRSHRHSKLGETLLEDLTEGNVSHSIQQDLEDVYEFYLDDTSRRELAEMGQFQRSVMMASWLLRNSILELIPARRLLLLISGFCFTLGLIDSTNPFLMTGGFLMLLFVLLLELKDKLLAQDELATGRAVQFALMPQGQPELPGWDIWVYTKPANEVGGDLVDYLHVDDDQLGIALGDVAGKGLGAALMMAKLQSILRAMAPVEDSLPQLGGAINETMRRDGLPDRFTSLVYLELAPFNSTVRLINAGHMPPVLVRKNSVETLPKGEPALGLMGGVTYTEHQRTLQPHDVLVIYSDGLTEARNTEGEFFGEERLRELLPDLHGLTAQEAGMLLRVAAERFAHNARPSDDLSLVIVRYTGEMALPTDPFLLPQESNVSNRSEHDT